MHNTPFFSVVIPLYNRADTVTETLQSVLSQTFTDFEIVIIDDGSSDSPEKVIEQLNDARIRFIRQDNGGGSKARNTGMQAAKGRYIAFLDSDDLYLPEHLNNAATQLKLTPNVCIYTQVKVDRGDDVCFVKPHRALLPDEHISDYLMADRGFVQTSTLVIPIELASKIQYDEKIASGQDYDFAIKICAAGYSLVMLDQPGAIWNDQWCPTRLSSKSHPEQRLQWLERIKSMITNKAYWAEKGWPIAKGFASEGKKLKGLKLYFGALIRGYYRPKMAIVIFLQVALSKANYRKLSDVLARFGVNP